MRALKMFAAVTDLAVRARARTIREQATGGASVPMSSLGAVGGEAVTPAVNLPEAATLGVSRVKTRPAWDGEALGPGWMAPPDPNDDRCVINASDAARVTTGFGALMAISGDGLDRMAVTGDGA